MNDERSFQMEKYQTPELELIEFETEDVITTSIVTNPQKGDLPVL